MGRNPTGKVRDARGLVPMSAKQDPVYVEMVASICKSSMQMKRALATIGTERAKKFLEQIVRYELQGRVTGRLGPDGAEIARRDNNPSLLITRAAKSAGIGIDEFADMWRTACQAKAMMTIISASPQLAADVIEAASNYTTVCPSCAGDGSLIRRDDSILTCPQCDGKGSIRRPGDRDAREHALEWAGVINQGPKGGQSSPGGVFLSLVLPRASDLDKVSGPATVDIKQITE